MCDNSLRRFERVRLVYVRYRFFLSKGGSNFYASPMVKSYFVLRNFGSNGSRRYIFLVRAGRRFGVFRLRKYPTGKVFLRFRFCIFLRWSRVRRLDRGLLLGRVLFSSVEIYRVADANRCRPNKSLSVLTSQYPSEKSISDISRAKIGLISK